MSDSWKVLESESIFEMGYLKIRSEKCELPDGRIMPRYFTVDFTDWVQVMALTPQKEVVLVKQYRHAARVTCFELPGGAMSMSTFETPLQACLRELEEETGYLPKQEMQYLGFHYPNPALQSNKVHAFLAIDCEKVKEPQLDPFEDLTTVLKPVEEVFSMMDRGEFVHSLMVPSLVLAKKALGL